MQSLSVFDLGALEAISRSQQAVVAHSNLVINQTCYTTHLKTPGTVLCVTSISTAFVLLPQHREPSPVLLQTMHFCIAYVVTSGGSAGCRISRVPSHLPARPSR